MKLEKDIMPVREIGGLKIGAHILCLCALVISRPLFDLFGGHPEYFVVNRIRPPELYWWVAILSFAIPTVMSSGVLFVGAVARPLKYPTYALCLSFLVGLFALQLSNHIGFSTTLEAIAFTGSIVALTLWFVIAKPQLTFGITLLTPIIVIFPLLFVFSESIQKVLSPDSDTAAEGDVPAAIRLEHKPPIFFVIFDELSLIDLLDAKGDIDAGRFPNIAAFSRESTWYANATTVRHATTWAVPAILTGNQPRTEALPRFEDYPRNLFSLLRPHYDFKVIEPVTQLNDQDSRDPDFRTLLEDTLVVYLHMIAPEALSDRLPPVSSGWGNFLAPEDDGTQIPTAVVAEQPESAAKAFLNDQQRKRFIDNTRKDRGALFQQFIDSFEPSPRNSLYFLHILLPHEPAVYLPSGRRYNNPKILPGLKKHKRRKSWVGDQSLVDKAHQRHLLQLGYVDTLWGRMIDRIKALGIYEQSLVVMVADHGVSYQKNVSYRRPVAKNFAEIAFVPLLIKFPEQAEAVRNETNVETIDILPTLVDVLGIEVPWSFDGRSLVDSDAQIRDYKKLQGAGGKSLEYTRPEFLAARREALARNVETFHLEDPRASMFNYEDGLELLGRPLADVASSRLACRVRSKSPGKLRSIDNEADFLPLRIFGELKCRQGSAAHPLLVIGLDDEVIGVTRPYWHDDAMLFDHVVSDKAIGDSGGRLEIKVIDYPPDRRP